MYEYLSALEPIARHIMGNTTLKGSRLEKFATLLSRCRVETVFQKRKVEHLDIDSGHTDLFKVDPKEYTEWAKLLDAGNNKGDSMTIKAKLGIDRQKTLEKY